MKPLIEKYAPKAMSDIVGQDGQIAQLHLYAKDYAKQKKKAVLLFGPTGCGKTSAAYAIAKELGLEIVEINASDFRNAEGINSFLGGAIGQQSLFSRGKLILVDEIDGLAGNSDRGGIQALLKLMEKSTYPLFLTATNPYDNKLSSLRSKSVMVEFGSMGQEAVAKILKHICQKENIPYTDDVLQMIARRCGGDARAAINNLQTIAIIAKGVTKEAVEELSDRDKADTILAALQKIFKGSTLDISAKAFDAIEEDVDERFLWIDENLPKEYEDPKALARAYDALSKADVFNSRIRRWQHYRFLVYVNLLLSGGVATAKDERNKNFIPYSQSGRILKLWWAKQKSMKKKAIAQKIAQKTHTSSKRILQGSLPYLHLAFSKDNEFQKKLIEELELDEEEVEWLKGHAPKLSA